MTDTHSANFELTSRASSPKTLTTTNVYPPSRPREDIEIQLPQFPDKWKPPSRLPFRCIFAFMCWIALGETNLEQFWQDLSEENGWETCHARFRDAVMQLTTAQGLVLGAGAAFLTTIPPVNNVNYSSPKCYALFAMSFLVSIWGLVSQLLFFRVNQALFKQRHLLTQEPWARYVVMNYLTLVGFPQYAFFGSLLFLASAIVEALLGGVNSAFLFLAFSVAGTVFTVAVALLMRVTPERNINLMTGYALFTLAGIGAASLALLSRCYSW